MLTSHAREQCTSTGIPCRAAACSVVDRGRAVNSRRASTVEAVPASAAAARTAGSWPAAGERIACETALGVAAVLVVGWEWQAVEPLSSTLPLTARKTH